MSDVVIVSGARTPVGSFLGSFAAVPAHKLGEVAIRAALARAGVEPGDVSEVILGQVLTAAQGQNPARQAAIAAGLPNGTSAWGINMVCGSGLRAVALGAQAIGAVRDLSQPVCLRPRPRCTVRHRRLCPRDAAAAQFRDRRTWLFRPRRPSARYDSGNARAHR